MAAPERFEVIRDPLWSNIRIDAEALGVLDSQPFQRLRYVRQLGHAFLVYPGATHTRFEHALGTYHLAGRAISLLRDGSQLEDISGEEILLVRLAALLHDIGHYPFSHALEEAGLPSHEDLAREHLDHPELRAALESTDVTDPGNRIAQLIVGKSGSPLQGLISGSLDLDKIEYLTRDAWMCGVPYGAVDVDRLLHSITLVRQEDGRPAIGVHEKGLSALESLLFAKYQMYRNVYWHHAVRGATVMFKRVVSTAITQRRVTASWISHSTDDALMETLLAHAESPVAVRLVDRRLYKRALDIPAGALPANSGDWVADDPDLVYAVEDSLARQVGLAEGELLIDFPSKPQMLAADLPVLTRAGSVTSLSSGGGRSLMGLQEIADELHTTARRFRVFVARAIQLDKTMFTTLVEHSAPEVREELGKKGAVPSSTR